MQIGPQGFNAAQYEPAMAMEKWPDGWHDLVIINTDGKPTATGNGGKLQLLCQGISGAVAGKQTIINLNLWNTNPQAVEIANREMSAIVHVTLGANQGRLTFNDTNELCNIPFKALFATQKDDARYNNVIAYADQRGNDPKGRPVNTGQATGAPTGQPASQFQQPPAGQPPQGWAPPQQQPNPAGQPAQAPNQWAPPGAAPQAPQGQPQPSWAGPGVGGAPQGNGAAPGWAQPGQQPMQPPQGQPAPQQWQQPGPGPAPNGAPVPAWAQGQR